MLQSHICVSPRLPPSPPPLPSLMPKEEIVPGKHGVRVEPDPRGPRGDLGVYTGRWHLLDRLGGHRYGSGGSTAPSDAPRQQGGC